MAASRSRSGRPAAAISTMVPSSGRARRRLSQAMTIGGEDAFDAFGDMVRRKRRAGDVADVLIDRERARTGLANELRQPARLSDLTTIGLAILQDLDAEDAAARVERDCVVDVQVLADHMIEHEQAERPSAGVRLPGTAGLSFDELGRRRKG